MPSLNYIRTIKQQMGDRTTVYFTVLKEHVKEALSILEMGIDSSDLYSADSLTATYCFDEINNGELDGLNELRKKGIPYTSNWCSGSEYGPGKETCRYTEQGEIEIKYIYDDSINPDLQNIFYLINNYEALRDYILKHRADVTPLPWNNQLEYSKLYLLNQLISPD
jgi:hypothetical protein